MKGSVGAAIRLEALEARLLMSAAAPPAAATAPTAQPLRAPTPSAFAPATAAPAVTLADRWDLLAHWASPISKSLKYRLKANDAPGFDQMLLDYMVTRTGPRYLFDPASVPTSVAFIKANLDTKVNDKLAQANGILGHVFPQQVGSDVYSVHLPAGTIDWTTPPAGQGSDFVHALNRHTFWPDLAQAYQLTGDARYVRELSAQLVSWSAQNPPLANADDWSTGTATGWWLLDVADRTSQWLRAYFLVLGTSGWKPEANTLFLKRLWDQGDFLARATPGKVAANRTALQATALANLAMVMPEYADAPAWELAGQDLTFKCLAAQFRPDGGHVEQSPNYQASAISAFLDNYRLAELNGRAAWTRNRRRVLVNAVEGLYQLLSPDATLPGLSDTFRTSRVTPFLTRAGLLLQEPRYAHDVLRIDDVWLFPPAQVQPFLAGTRALLNRGIGYAMPDSGYYVLRGKSYPAISGTGEGQSVQLIFDAGPKGGTHGHSDLLNFELYNDQKPVVSDPGPFAYDDSPERRWAVSTPAHNTISIDGLSHADVEAAHDPAIAVDDFELAADHAQVTAHHHAYEYLKGKPVVGRTVWIDRTSDDPVVLVLDWGHAAATHTFTSSFLLPTAPTDTVSKVYDGGIDIETGLNQITRVQTLAVAGQGYGRERRSVSNAPPPAAAQPATRFTVSQRGRDAVIGTLISYRHAASGYSVTASWETPPAPGKTLHIRLTYSDGTTRVLSFTPPSLAALTEAAPAAHPAQLAQPLPTLAPATRPALFARQALMPVARPLTSAAGDDVLERNDGLALRPVRTRSLPPTEAEWIFLI